MKLDTFDVIRLELPLRKPFRSTAATTATRSLILVRAESDGKVGWGEASPFHGHTPDSVDVAWRSLRAVAERSSDGHLELESTEPGTSSRAALDGALTTLRAARDHKSLATALGGVAGSVKASASIGLQPTILALVSSVANALDAGYRRVKVKVALGTIAQLSVIRRRFPDLEIGLDANGVFTPQDLPALRGLDTLSIAFLEQPFPVGLERESAELAAVLHTPVALDESIMNLASVRAALSGPTVDVLTLKPARFGVTDCLVARDLAHDKAVAVRVGGMLESGVGRAIGTALAACEGFTVFGDISASGWHYPTDLTSLDQQSGLIQVPMGDGLGLDVTIDQSRVVDQVSYTWPQQ